MLSFFKKNKNDIKKQGADTSIHSKELLGVEDKQSEQLVKTSLSFHPLMNVSEEEQYYFQFLNNELTPLKKNQISISGIDLKMDEDKLFVTAFIRNSLSKGIKFEKDVPLLLLGPDGSLLARQTFDFTKLGELPAESSRPWQFTFEKSQLVTEEIPTVDWKLAFELKQPHRLDLEESWEKALPQQEKESLEKLVNDLTPPKKGEVNFMGIQARKSENGSFHITLLIRNGHEKNISLQQIPLVVEDAAGDVVAKGGFQLNDLEVKANTSKPWTFIFPKEMVQKEAPDLSKWRAYPLQG